MNRLDQLLLIRIVTLTLVLSGCDPPKPRPVPSQPAPPVTIPRPESRSEGVGVRVTNQQTQQAGVLTATFTNTTAGSWLNLDGVTVGLNPSPPPRGVTEGVWYHGTKLIPWAGPGFNQPVHNTLSIWVGRFPSGRWTSIVRCGDALNVTGVNTGDRDVPLVFTLAVSAPEKHPTHRTVMTVN